MLYTFCCSQPYLILHLKKDVKILTEILELQLVSRKGLRNIFFIRCQDADESVKKCLMDGLKKQF